MRSDVYANGVSMTSIIAYDVGLLEEEFVRFSRVKNAKGSGNANKRKPLCPVENIWEHRETTDLIPSKIVG